MDHASWGTSENNRRARYYTITAAGKRELAQVEAEWTKLVGGVARVLKQA